LALAGFVLFFFFFACFFCFAINLSVPRGEL
jgi:hypothetical protein